MNFSIREATITDAPSITKLSSQLGYNLSEQQTAHNLALLKTNPSDIVFVAIHNENIIGWIHLFIAVRVESETFAEIGGLVVDEQFKRQGVGKQLITAAKNWTATNDLATLRVRCNVKRIDAHTFYRLLEFCENKEQKVFELKINEPKK